MAEPETAPAPEKPEPAARTTRRRAPKAAAASEAPAKPKKSEAPKAPRRPTLSDDERRLLGVRQGTSRRRARFTRQASYRYYRIGRDGAWRKPRGLQSKQRRHYKYRSAIVRIGYRGPADARGRTPSGFRPVVGRTVREIEAIEPAQSAAVIARSVGTRRRLTLEEAARRRGVHVLNPIVHDAEEGGT